MPPGQQHPATDPEVDEELLFEATAHASQLNFLPEPEADLPGYQLSEADRQLDLVYGDHYHDNDGSHLAGNLESHKDRQMQRLWLRTVQISPVWYKVPQGPVGRDFVKLYANEIRGVINGTWNSERPSIFPSLMLFRAQNATTSKDIRALIKQRMQLWKQGRFILLVNSLTDETARRGLRNGKPPTEEQIFCTFNTNVLNGSL